MTYSDGDVESYDLLRLASKEMWWKEYKKIFDVCLDQFAWVKQK